MKRKVTLILNLLSILILVGILFSYAMFQGGFVSWFLFSSFLPILIYHLVFILHPIKNWNVSRKFSHKTIRAGESIRVIVQIERKIPFPIYYCVVEDEFSDTLNRLDIGREKYRFMDQPDQLRAERNVKQVILPWFSRHFQVEYSLDHLSRGIHHWKGVRIRIGDIFGFVKKEHVFRVEDELLVYPNPLPAHLNQTLGDYENGRVSSGTSFQHTNIAVGVREYEPGDRFSRIDWKQTAKKNTMMSKEFERERSTNVTIVLDSCSHLGLQELAHDASIELTLGLMESLQKRNTKVRLLVIRGMEKDNFWEYDQGSWKEVLHYLTVLQPKESASFTRSLKEQMQRINDGMTVVLTSYVDEELEEIVERSNRRMSVLVIHSASSNLEKERIAVERWKAKGLKIQPLTKEHLVAKQMEVDVK